MQTRACVLLLALVGAHKVDGRVIARRLSGRLKVRKDATRACARRRR
jgi:hypothetical protein